MDDYVKFDISNEGLKSMATGEFDSTAVSNLNVQFKALKEGIESATQSILFLKKTVDEAGYAKMSFSVPKNYAPNMEETLRKLLAKLESSSNLEAGSFSFTSRPVKILEFVDNFYGTVSKRILKEEAKKAGANVVSDADTIQKDRMKVQFPVTEKSYKEALKKYGEEVDDKLIGLFREKYLSESDAKSNDYKKKIEERDAEKARIKEEKANETDKSRILSVLGTIGRILATGVFFLKSIFASGIKSVIATDANSWKAINVGIAPESDARYRGVEKNRGMASGTFIKAFESIESNLGDVSNLNTGTISELAKVLQGDTIKAINAGLGKNNPEAVTQMILDAYYKRGINGVNSLGMNVGQYHAQRELATALEKAGLGEIAEILRNMFYTNNTGNFAGTITGFNDYVEKTSSGTLGVDAYFLKQVAESGETWRSLLATLGSLIELIKNKLMVKLEPIAEFLEGAFIKFFGTPEQKQLYLEKQETRKDVEKRKAEGYYKISTLLGEYSTNPDDRILYAKTAKEFQNDAESKNPNTLDNIDKQKKFFKEKISPEDKARKIEEIQKGLYGKEGAFSLAPTTGVGGIANIKINTEKLKSVLGSTILGKTTPFVILDIINQANQGNSNFKIPKILDSNKQNYENEVKKKFLKNANGHYQKYFNSGLEKIINMDGIPDQSSEIAKTIIKSIKDKIGSSLSGIKSFEEFRDLHTLQNPDDIQNLHSKLENLVKDFGGAPFDLKEVTRSENGAFKLIIELKTSSGETKTTNIEINTATNNVGKVIEMNDFTVIAQSMQYNNMG